jgi:hypothetical protein
VGVATAVGWGTVVGVACAVVVGAVVGVAVWGTVAVAVGMFLANKKVNDWRLKKSTLWFV